MAELDRQVSQDADDMYTYGGAVREDREYVYVNYNTAESLLGGFRFLNVTVPQGATITSAKLSVYRYGGAPVDITLYGEDADNSGVLEGGTLLDDREKTTASVAWSGDLAADAFTDSPEIKTIIQEIVDREGWSSGNALTIITVDSQSAFSCQIYDYQGIAARAAKLHIEYAEQAKGTQAWIGKWP